ncbi:dihydrofolate reductase [Lojkania enalia]|uniref:Dihydrofolate reductase n=1 Tax=Lojkania enalia TaxID=147567 RepID=A0A9P4TRF3_9PLEO|nr:dihydrofolate reductase [Didymosphaeria enalia]
MRPPTSIPSSVRNLTLILAATPSLGIGKAGTLPWPMLKKEMGFFARVTKRVSPSQGEEIEAGKRRVNAVVMGRRTWESIPQKFRPLKDRLNAVITRSPEAVKVDGTEGGFEGPIVASSIISVLERLVDRELVGREGIEVEKVFVIGGASIYKAALELRQTDRVLLTKIKKEYECDTFLDMDLDREDSGWTRKSREELGKFVGEEISEEDVEEQGVRFEFCLYERNRPR